MPITEGDYKSLIIHELQLDALSDAIWVDVIWETYREKSYVASRLQYLYTKRSLATILLSRLSDSGMDWKAGDYSESSSGAISVYRAAIQFANNEIKEILAKTRANRVGKVGEITKVAPIESVTPQMDPNSRAYRGDPLRRY